MLDLERAQIEAAKVQNKTASEKTEDLEKAQEIINQENMGKLAKLHIGQIQKAGIMLVALGLKPATELDLYARNDGKEKVLTVLAEAGLECLEKERPAKSKAVARIAIAQNQELLGKLLIAEADRDHEEFGRLMGYPETAYAAFRDKSRQLPAADCPGRQDIIFSFKLSKDGYQEEIKLLKKWSEAIKHYCPELYKSLAGAD